MNSEELKQFVIDNIIALEQHGHDDWDDGALWAFTQVMEKLNESN